MKTTVLRKAAKLKNAAGTTVKDRAYHAWHNRQAQHIIDSMKTEGGKTVDEALFKKCDEYARDVLGSDKYSPWLKAYTLFAGEFKEGWIPDNYYGHVVGPKLQGDYGDMSHFKAVSARLFKTDLLPDLAYAVNGLVYTTSMEAIEPAKLKNVLFANTDKVVYKLDNGGQGKSVFVYDANNFPNASTVFENGVFQSYINQHALFNEFSSKSVSTIRLTTIVDDAANVWCRAAYLRIPRSTETHVKSETAVKVALNIDTGQLHDQGYLPNWTPVARHPDSNTSFAGQVVPNFSAAVQACVALHTTLPFARAIGWDLIVDANDKVAIMEWNGHHNDIKFSEATTGPCFADLGWQNLWK